MRQEMGERPEVVARGLDPEGARGLSKVTRTY
jgi:hypothetical protein